VYLTTGALSNKSQATIMQTIILIVSFILTGALASWAVIKGERDKKAKRLLKNLVLDFKDTPLDEIRDIRKNELFKSRKDKVKILALKYLIEERQGHPEEIDLSRLSISNKYIDSFLKKLDPFFEVLEVPFLIISKIILAVLLAIVATAFVVVFVLFFLGSLTTMFKE
jgi:hypothetical protein